MDIGVDNVNPILVGKCCVGSFPGCDTTTTGTENDGGLFDPSGAKTIEEVSFAGNFTVFKVRVAKLADIYLQNL